MTKLVKLDFVRATYWLGAIVDALAGVQLLTPVGTKVLGFEGLRAPGAAGAPAITAAALMFAWSAVLIWAHLRTRQRRTILAITGVLVFALAAANVTYGVTGVEPWADLAAPLAIQAVLLVMFSVAHSIARAAARDLGVA